MAFSFIFGGVRSEYHQISINAVRRSLLQPIAPRTISVPDRVGLYFFKNDITERTIEVDITLHESSQTALRARIEEISVYLDPTKGTNTLVFDDYTTRTYFAVLSDKTDFNQILALGQGTLIFLVPDGVAYSSSSITVDATPPTGTVAGSISFTRGSTAYKEDGTSVGGNSPRYESCANNSNGIRIEEGTTNLLTADESSFETNTGNLIAVGSATISDFNYTFSKQGIRSFKIITGGVITGEGVTLFTPGNVAASATTTYTFSLFVIGDPSPLEIKIDFYNAGAALISSSTSSSFTPNLTGFTRFSYTFTTPATTASLIYSIITAIKVETVFYIDCLQLEQKPYATGWQIGGIARASELCKINPTNYLTPQRGTIDFFFKPTGKPGNFGGILEMGRFSANSSRDRFTLVRGTCEGGAKAVQFIVASSATQHATTLSINLPTTWITDNVYYCAIRWYFDGTLGNSFMKINVADLTNNVEYSTTLATTQAFPLFSDATIASTLFFGSLRNGAFWSNCIYDDLRFTNVVRNNTDITGSWQSRRPLLKDSIATTKYNFNNTLAATVLSNLGTAPVDPIITVTFIDKTTTATLTQFKPGATSETYVFQTSGLFSAGTQLTINCLNRTVTSTTGGLINSRVQLLSDFPKITGDHYYSVTPLGSVPSHNPKITVTYTPRWL